MGKDKGGEILPLMYHLYIKYKRKAEKDKGQNIFMLSTACVYNGSNFCMLYFILSSLLILLHRYLHLQDSDGGDFFVHTGFKLQTRTIFIQE